MLDASHVRNEDRTIMLGLIGCAMDGHERDMLASRTDVFIEVSDIQRTLTVMRPLSAIYCGFYDGLIEPLFTYVLRRVNC